MRRAPSRCSQPSRRYISAITSRSPRATRDSSRQFFSLTRSGIAVLFEQLGVLFQCEKMRLCTVGLLHLLDDELAEPFELKKLLFAGGGADVAYDFLSDLVAVAHRLYDLQDISVREFFSAHEHGDIYRTKPGWKCINVQSCGTTLPRLGNRG